MFVQKVSLVVNLLQLIDRRAKFLYPQYITLSSITGLSSPVLFARNPQVSIHEKIVEGKHVLDAHKKDMLNEHKPFQHGVKLHKLRIDFKYYIMVLKRSYDL